MLWNITELKSIKKGKGNNVFIPLRVHPRISAPAPTFLNQKSDLIDDEIEVH